MSGMQLRYTENAYLLMEAGALRRPTWAEYCAEFGCKRVSKSSLSDYTDPMKNKFDDEPQFWAMVDEFIRLAR